MLARFVIPLLLLLSPALAQIHNVTWIIRDDQVFAPDGFPRRAVSINNVTLGPILHATKGDFVIVNNLNLLSDPVMDRNTSIHWHGMFMKHNATQDGVAYITQCPMAPSVAEYYTYQFFTDQQTGTYWYHSHLNDQYCDGLRGAFVILDPLDAKRFGYDVDDDTTIVNIADWYHVNSVTAFSDPSVTEVLPDSILINGAGRYPQGPKVPLSVFPVTKGKRYRFRIVNTSCLAAVAFSIDGHNLTIIEVDGVLTEKHSVESIHIFPGQRYSVKVTADKPNDNYWIRTVPITSMNYTYPGNITDKDGINLAILRYDGVKPIDPVTPFKNRTKLNEWDLRVYGGRAKPGPPTKTINFTFGFNGTTGLFNVNGASWAPPTVAILLQILTNDSSLVPPGSLYPVTFRDKVRLQISHNAPYESAHPFHLHGHVFDVIQAANQSTPPNEINPPQRDVLPIWGNKTVIIQFDADNPGPWIFHCHIDWHLNRGLAVVFVEAEKLIPWDMPVPPQWAQLCASYLKHVGGGFIEDDPIHYDLDQVVLSQGLDKAI